MRSILLDKDEATWLLKFFKDLVTVQDRIVFWNQSISGFPRILAQQCSNRHGFFLIIEEYEGRRRSGSVLVPKGRIGEGWERFGVELRLAFNCLLVGPSSYSKQPRLTDNTHSKPKPELRRSFAEVLRSSSLKVEEHFSPSNRPLARVPRRLTDPMVARVTLTSSAAVKDSQAKPVTGKSASLVKDFPAKAFLPKTVSASLFASPGRVSGSSLRGRTAGSSSPTLTSATRKSHFGESLDLCSLRKTLERLHVEIGHCLSDLYLLEDGLLGNEPKPPGSSSLPKTQPDSLGSRVPRPISKKHSGPLLA
jgi:hypothetical protein